MSEFEGEIEQLERICPGTRLMTEGGLAFAFLPELKFRSRGATLQMDALLAPQGHSGYETRLFFDQQLPDISAAWYQQQILGRTWHALSWRGVSPSQPWTRILAEQLRPFA
ncbi:MAG TPA: hypothetical protein VF680_07450 [Allosphingosinicella sp.]